MSLSWSGRDIDAASRFSSVDELRDRMIARRGIVDTERFFAPDFSHLSDPFLFPGMDRAVDRVLHARQTGERVVVFGDYDVDGVSATALLVRFFHEIGVQVSYRLPHRVRDGYGFRAHFLDDLSEKSVKLIITVDCGTRDTDTIATARSRGIDVIVTDHHSVPETLPDALAVLNPRLPDTSYPFPGLSGAGVAFQFLHAVALQIFSHDEIVHILRKYIDLAALGTIADCMDLVGENRVIASLGLSQMRESCHPGLARLVGERLSDGLESDVVGFHIGPRLNAAWRLDDALLALRTLLAREENLDGCLAALEQLNLKRRALTDRYFAVACESVDASEPVLFFVSDDIPHGLTGLVAWRLSEQFRKPACCLRREDGVLIASCRSPEYLDIIGLLSEFSRYFLRFGGHRQAAGFTMDAMYFEEFQKKILAHTRTLFPDAPPVSCISPECILDISHIDAALISMLATFAPYWPGNEKPLFLMENVRLSRIDFLGDGMRHLRFFITDCPQGVEIMAFWWGAWYDRLRATDVVSLVVEVSVSSFRGRRKIQLLVRDIFSA